MRRNSETKFQKVACDLPLNWEKIRNYLPQSPIMQDEMEYRDAASGISGSISIACWVFLLVPQVWENFRNKSAEGLSLSFLLIWSLGDVTNLAGALWGRLLGTVVLLAAYFCVADSAMVGQILWYRHIKSSGMQKTAERSDRQPLLGRRESIARERTNTATTVDSALRSLRERRTYYKAVGQNVLALIAVCAAGSLGWYVTDRVKPDFGDLPKVDNDIEIGPQVLGYISAVCYLGARIPQIIQNHQRKSCQGLAILFFLFSCLGNITYAMGILFYSSDKDYLVKNTPWLIGSLGTIFQDMIIFAQFFLYAVYATEDAVETDE